MAFYNLFSLNLQFLNLYSPFRNCIVGICGVTCAEERQSESQRKDQLHRDEQMRAAM